MFEKQIPLFEYEDMICTLQVYHYKLNKIYQQDTYKVITKAVQSLVEESRM